MLTIIAGSLVVATYKDLIDAIETSPFKPTGFICGNERRIDLLSEQYAREHNLPIYRVDIDRVTYGGRAELIRNTRMLDMAEAVIVLWCSMNADMECIVEAACIRRLATYVHSILSMDY